ncbi:MAG: hypothetical protein Q7J29_01970 [Stagnimonas sp.]|nr:hypothetical protein [Stagnimonas sp.]
MSNQLLSAAVDAAATEAEWDALIESVENDPELKAEWSRVWQWRDARDGVTLAAGDDFCSGVMAAIANEKPLPSTVVTMPRRAATVAARPARSWRTLVPLSAAAGVVAAVLFVGGLRGPASNNGSDLATSQVASSGQMLATTPVSFSSAESGGDALPDDAKAAILNAYLMEHSNSLAERSMGGTLANARFAARTADYRPDAQ